jgi:calcineurin-like phosphoesterase family protein
MDAAMIRNWNNVVSKRDMVIVAGDVSFYGKDQTSEIIRQLHGKKVLVKGNHDQRNNQWWMDVGFDEVSSYPIIFREWFIIQHEPPTYINDAMPFFWIYGHTHGTDMYRTITKNTACVSIERWDYTPVELGRILELAKLATK